MKSKFKRKNIRQITIGRRPIFVHGKHPDGDRTICGIHLAGRRVTISHKFFQPGSQRSCLRCKLTWRVSGED